jgi:very-short-patch-repair endonuclease
LHDKERTERLEECGWKLITRIRWSEYQKKKNEEKREYILHLQEKLLYY